MTPVWHPDQLDELRIKLRNKLVKHFSDSELRDLCFDLKRAHAKDLEGLDYESLPGYGKTDKARELVEYFERRERIFMLLEKCRELRPLVDWPTWSPVPSNVHEGIADKPVSRGRGCYLRYGKLAVIVALLTITVIVIAWFFAKKHTPSFTPASTVVALRAWNGMYVTVTDITTTGTLKANAAQKGDQQRFTLLCLADGKAAFQISKRFVSALNDEDDRNWELRAVATNQLAWEEFALVDPNTQDPLLCDQVLKRLQQGEVSLAFRTDHNRFVTAMEQDAGWVLKAETTVLGKHQEFTAINLASTLTPTPCAVCAGCIVGQRYGCSANLPAEQVPYCTETLTLTSPATATQIGIEMTRRALEDYGYSLYEVEAYGPGNPQINLLKEGTVTVSSTEDSRYVAPYAIDGNLLSRWASAKCCNSGPCRDDKGNLKCDNPDGQDPQWLNIILPRPAPIDHVVLKWERAYAVEYCVIVNP